MASLDAEKSGRNYFGGGKLIYKVEINETNKTQYGAFKHHWLVVESLYKSKRGGL